MNWKGIKLRKNWNIIKT